MTLRACATCRRHFADEPACPFCGAAAPARVPRALPTARLSRAAAFAGAALAGCWTSNPPPPSAPQSVTQTTQTAETQTQQQTFADPPPRVANSRIEGVVTDDATGIPRVNVIVSLARRQQQGAQGPATVRTDVNGRYVFEKLEAGDYVVTFRQPHPRAVPTQVTVKLGTDDTQTANATVAGFIPSNIPTPYGAPPARTRVV